MITSIIKLLSIIVPFGLGILFPVYLSADMANTLYEFIGAAYELNGLVPVSAIIKVICLILIVHLAIFMLRLFLIIVGWISR